MIYEAPQFEDIKMDAEVGSYQEDFEFEPEPQPGFDFARAEAVRPREVE